MKNRKILMDKCGAILTDINRSLESMNPKILHPLKSIFESVSEKWDTKIGKISVNSFFFLRYICPFLVNPSSLSLFFFLILFHIVY